MRDSVLALLIGFSLGGLLGVQIGRYWFEPQLAPEPLVFPTLTEWDFTADEHTGAVPTFSFDTSTFSTVDRGCHYIVKDLDSLPPSDEDWVCTEGCKYAAGFACCEAPDGSIECFQ